MNMKKISGIVAGVALACGMAAPASAVTLTAGDIKITFNAFDAGTIGYPTDKVGTICTSVEDCNTKGSQPSRGGIDGEDTWGIFSVESISNLTTGKQIFTAGQNGQFLTGIFGGLKDTYVERSSGVVPSINTLSTGGWLNMYLNSSMYNAELGTNGRIDSDGYKGITDIGGTLVLETVFAPNVLSTPLGYSYASSYKVNGATGEGSGFLDVVGGAWAEEFDTNSIPDLGGGTPHDLILNTSFDLLNGYDNGWNVDASGDVEGRLQDVPEPGSLALLGLGFAGLAGLRRRRTAK